MSIEEIVDHNLTILEAGAPMALLIEPPIEGEGLTPAEVAAALDGGYCCQGWVEGGMKCRVCCEKM